MAEAVKPPINFKSGVKHAIVGVLNEYLSGSAFSEYGMEDITVGIEFPDKEEIYPYIEVDFKISDISPTNLNYGIVDDYGDIGEWKFTGKIGLAVYALTALEKDNICDGIISMVGCWRTFKDSLYNNELIAMEPNCLSLSEDVDTKSIGTPWDADKIIYNALYSFPIVGLFYWHSGESITPALVSRIGVTMKLQDLKGDDVGEDSFNVE